MNFDLEHKVLSSATELFGMALSETSTEEEHREACEQCIRDLLNRYPDTPLELLWFAMGRALGRFEVQMKARKR